MDISKREEVYQIVKQIPKGRVVSYGQIARIIGLGPRWVGRVLHENPYEGAVPCHRVVRAGGDLARTFAFGGDREQRKRLETEGVRFKGDKVDMDKCRWQL